MSWVGYFPRQRRRRASKQRQRGRRKEVNTRCAETKIKKKTSSFTEDLSERGKEEVGGQNTQLIRVKQTISIFNPKEKKKRLKKDIKRVGKSIPHLLTRVSR